MVTKKIGTSLQAINAQIAALQVQADAIRKREVGDVVAKIKDAIAHYGLTAADLGLEVKTPKRRTYKSSKSGRKPRREAGGKAAGGSTRPAKYTDGQGRTWGGMGKRPDWFKAALAAGKSPEDMLIKS
jgi:DNA-binding protein H-NS